MGNQTKLIKLKQRDAGQGLTQSISMLEVLRLFSYETPPYVRLNKLQFHRFQDSHPSTGKDSNYPIQYHVHVYGEILEQHSKSRALTEKFVERLKGIECIRNVQLLQPPFGTDTHTHEFELKAII